MDKTQEIQKQSDMFDEMDDLKQISRRPRKGASGTPPPPSAEPHGLTLESMLSREKVEIRSEVLSLRITPTAKRRLEAIWMDQLKKDKRAKMSAIASDLLIQILES